MSARVSLERLVELDLADTAMWLRLRCTARVLRGLPVVANAEDRTAHLLDCAEDFALHPRRGTLADHAVVAARALASGNVEAALTACVGFCHITRGEWIAHVSRQHGVEVSP